VVLSHPSELDAAMRRNRNYMGSRYIEVFEARKTDYYNAIYDVVSANDEGSFGALAGRGGAGRWGPYGAQGSPREGRERRYSDGGGRERSRSPVGGKDGGPLSTSIVKLRGLPFSAKEEEIVEFFADEELELTAFPTLEE
jgi:heterogeneous nuclear ribonucleoprotein F/H